MYYVSVSYTHLETTEGTDDSQMKIYTEDQLQVDENGNVQTDGSEKDVYKRQTLTWQFLVCHKK